MTDQAILIAAAFLPAAFGSERIGHDRRYAMLKIMKHDLANPLTWVAPHGLIRVLLFSIAKEALALPGKLGGRVLMVVLLSAAPSAVAQVHAEADSETTTLLSTNDSRSV